MHLRTWLSVRFRELSCLDLQSTRSSLKELEMEQPVSWSQRRCHEHKDVEQGDDRCGRYPGILGKAARQGKAKQSCSADCHINDGLTDSTRLPGQRKESENENRKDDGRKSLGGDNDGRHVVLSRWVSQAISGSFQPSNLSPIHQSTWKARTPGSIAQCFGL